ncbi:MAG: hypothetical protein JSS09_01725, partial [Verrucomicrobia bacterium]|nr:hypothetical protein [Verrucomicrobiota bacterium]
MTYTTLHTAHNIVTHAAARLDSEDRDRPNEQRLTKLFSEAHRLELILKTRIAIERANIPWTSYPSLLTADALSKKPHGPSRRTINDIITKLTEVTDQQRFDRSIEAGNFNFPIVHTEAKRLAWEISRVKWTPKDMPNYTDPTTYIDRIGTNLSTENSETGIKTINYSTGAT